MNEEEARELAFRIIGEFEDLLADRDIMIPSRDREGREEEACIYGTEYYLLEDAITDILVRGSAREGKEQQALEMTFMILEEFEEVLQYHGLRIPSGEAGRQESDALIYGSDYDRLADAVRKLLLKQRAAAAQGDQRG